MGQSLSKTVLGAIVGRRAETRVLMLGLDASGKTSFLYLARLGEVVTTIPTIGFNVETLQYKNVEITAWDISSRDQIRPLWRHYFQNTNVILWFVDSNDRERVEKSREELERLYAEDDLRDAIYVVVANKQDLPGALRPEELVERFGLRETKLKWALFPVSVTEQKGITDVLQWLDAAFDKNATSLPPTRYGSSQLEQGVNLIAEGAAKKASSTGSVENDPIGWDAEAAHRKILSLSPAAQLTNEELLTSLREGQLPAAQYTHEVMLRCMWIHLSQITDRSKGRKQAVDGIMSDIKTYTERISRLFHMTHTYFWLQLVDLSLQMTDKIRESVRSNNMMPAATATTAEENDDVRKCVEFLQMNPWLLDHELMSRYYSLDSVLSDPAAFTEFKLPDLKQLPSIISFHQVGGAAEQSK